MVADDELKKTDKPDKKYLDIVKKRLGKDDGGDGKKGPTKKDPSKAIVMWLIVAAAVIFGLKFIENQAALRERKLSYSQFKALIAAPDTRMERAEVIQKGINRAELHGLVADAASLDKLPSVRQASSTRAFKVNLPFIDSKMLEEWDALGFEYTFEAEKMDWGDVVISLLPWLLMIFIWIFMIRQMQSGQKGIFSFGKSRAKLYPLDRPKNTFDDAAGVEEAKQELEEIIEFLRDPKRFNKLGGKIPKGVLLLGPPGTGKTLLARCVAGEAGVPFLSMSGSDFVEMFVGVGASRVRDLFDTAKKHSPCIIFIDEIDAVGRQRGAGLGGGHDEREQTLNQMLVEMDGFEENSGVILIAATNRPDVLDPALLRPGRFDRQVVVDMPDVRGREGILKVHTKKIPMAPDVDLTTIARGTPGFVGADLANLVNEAALMAARFGQEHVSMLDFEEAKDKVMMGAERKSMVMSDKERENTAFHEAGHAVCSLHCPDADPLHKVTIIPRGRALGLTFSLPEADKLTRTKEYYLDKICLTMGGRAAEELVFNTQSSGAYGDIKQATDLVRSIICDLGMTQELGPLSYGKKDEQIFLGREIARHRDYSEKTAQKIDELMRSIIDEQYQRARKILTDHRDQLDGLAKALLVHEMLDRQEVDKVVRGEKLDEAKKYRPMPPRETRSAEPAENDTASASAKPSQEGRQEEDGDGASRGRSH